MVIEQEGCWKRAVIILSGGQAKYLNCKVLTSHLLVLMIKIVFN